jgi:hypothetical protein
MSNHDRRHRSRMEGESRRESTHLELMPPAPLPGLSSREQRAITEARQRVTVRQPRAQVATNSPFEKGQPDGLTELGRYGDGAPGGIPVWRPTCGRRQIARWLGISGPGRP